MTSFGTVFKVMFANKRHFVQRLALLQFIAAIFIAIWWMLAEGNAHSDWQISGLLMFLTLMPFVDIFFLFASSYQNEKLLRAQSWNLIPTSSSNLYLANLCSAIVEGIYLVVIQIVLGLILAIPVTTMSGFWSNMQKQFGSLGEGKLWQYMRIEDTLGLAIFILLIAVFFYCLVSMINISSTVLSSFASGKYNKIIKFIIEVILLVIAIILLGRLSDFLFTTIEETMQLGMFQHVLGGKVSVEPSIWVTITITTILDLIMIVVNIWLLKNFYEAK